MVRIQDFHSWHRGSIPLGSTTININMEAVPKKYSSSWNVERRSSATHNIARRRLGETDKICPR